MDITYPNRNVLNAQQVARIVLQVLFALLALKAISLPITSALKNVKSLVKYAAKMIA